MTCRNNGNGKTNKTIREDSGIGIKPISIFGSKAWSAEQSNTLCSQSLKSVTIVHKGNIQKFTEGAFRDWGYELATQETLNA